MGNSQQQQTPFKKKKLSQEECKEMVDSTNRNYIQKANVLLNEIFDGIKQNNPSFESKFHIEDGDYWWQNEGHFDIHIEKTMEGIIENCYFKKNTSNEQIIFGKEQDQAKPFYKQQYDNATYIFNNKAYKQALKLKEFLDKSKKEFIKYRKDIYDNN